MAMYEWSEVFMSIEGEAKFSGSPTVYVRFARCNFKCKGFNNPENLDTESNEVLGFDPKDYKNIQDIPLIKRGCDSIYSWNDKFSHMWLKGNETILADEVLKVLPNNSFVMPSGKRVILSLTGGEPTIRIKFWIPLLERLYDQGMRSILIETNCASPLRDKDLTDLHSWIGTKALDSTNRNQGPVTIIWSNSPKIASSGETWKDAIRPEIALKQIHAQNILEQPWSGLNVEQYFKFVCGPYEKDFHEVENAMEEYFQAGIPRDTDVYIMPVACTTEQQDEISAKVAKMCIQHGYIYCHRIQMIFGNGVGT